MLRVRHGNGDGRGLRQKEAANRLASLRSKASSHEIERPGGKAQDMLGAL